MPPRTQIILNPVLFISLRKGAAGCVNTKRGKMVLFFYLDDTRNGEANPKMEKRGKAASEGNTAPTRKGGRKYVCMLLVRS